MINQTSAKTGQETSQKAIKRSSYFPPKPTLKPNPVEGKIDSQTADKTPDVDSGTTLAVTGRSEGGQAAKPPNPTAPPPATLPDQKKFLPIPKLRKIFQKRCPDCSGEEFWKQTSEPDEKFRCVECFKPENFSESQIDRIFFDDVGRSWLITWPKIDGQIWERWQRIFLR